MIRRLRSTSLAALLLTLAAGGGALAQATQNLFISPSGQPFYAPITAPYPIVDWFKQADKNGDGKIDAAEFRADAEAFFNVLDRDHNGTITSGEVYIYEHQMVPAILNQGRAAVDDPKSLLVRVQMTTPGDIANGLPGVEVDPGAGRTGRSLDGTEDKSTPDIPKQGAAFFSLFNEPEPIMAADRNFDFKVTLKEFMAQSDRHFEKLDIKNQGYFTLADLPKTSAEVLAKSKRASR